MGGIFALDSGAVISLARGDSNAAALLQKIRIEGGSFVVPAPVLAEVLRGGRQDVRIHRLLHTIDHELTTTPRAARAAGIALGRASRSESLTVDALIMETAIEHRAEAILTQDVKDMRLLSSGRIEVLPIGV